MGLAIELGQRGIRCVVVERRRSPQPIPKGQNLTQRTMEHFHFWGVEKAVRAARTIPREYGIGGLTAYGTLLGDYSYDWLQRELVRPFYFTDNERLPQYAMEAVLRRRVGRTRERADAVRLERRGREPGRSRRAGRDRGASTAMIAATLRADYAVGCDGSRSTVREQARDHADAFGPRQADGPAGVPLARPAPAPGALPRQILLQRPASRSRGLLEVLRPRGPRQHLVLPRAGAAGNDQGQFRLPPVSACGGRHGIRCRGRAMSASGTCASPSPTPTATGASSSPATPPTAIRPMAATASTSAWRTQRTWAGSLPPCCRAGAASKLLEFL